MRKILLALLAVAFVAAPAFASVQNVKVSGDIETTWLDRDQFDLGNQLPAESFDQSVLITQTRLRIDTDLTDNVSATVRLLNERVWGDGDAADAENTDIDLNLAYVTLREMLYSPLTVIVGRQEFKYGNSFIIDSGGTNNAIENDGGLNNVAEDLSKRSAMDAVRMVLDYNPLTIDLVAAKIDDNDSGGDDYIHDDDVNLFGVNSNYQLGDDMNTVVEGYFWAKLDNTTKATGLDYKTDTVYVPGIRGSINVLDGLNLQAEAAWQRGTKVQTTVADVKRANIRRDAFGAQFIANYAIPLEDTKEYNPMITTAYTYVSGDTGVASGKNPAAEAEDDTYSAWDPMFENQAGGKIYNSLFNLTNCHIGSIKGQISPLQDLTATAEWTLLWLAKEIKDDATPDDGSSTLLTLVQPNGSNIASVPTNDNRGLGQEMDLGLTYDYTEDVQIGASYSLFWPGNTFIEGNQTASQCLLKANVNF